MSRAIRLWFGTLVLTALASGCSSQEPQLPSRPPPIEPGEGYLLTPGDLITVKFYHAPELNEDVVVRPDGRITLQAVECLCACEAAPMAQVDDRYELHLTREKMDRILEELR